MFSCLGFQMLRTSLVCVLFCRSVQSCRKWATFTRCSSCLWMHAWWAPSAWPSSQPSSSRSPSSSCGEEGWPGLSSSPCSPSASLEAWCGWGAQRACRASGSCVSTSRCMPPFFGPWTSLWRSCGDGTAGRGWVAVLILFLKSFYRYFCSTKTESRGMPVGRWGGFTAAGAFSLLLLFFVL